MVFSLEKPKVKLLPFKGLSGEEENPTDYQVKTFDSTLVFLYHDLKLALYLFVEWLLAANNKNLT